METLAAIVATGMDLAPAQCASAVKSLVSTEVSDGEKMAFLKALRAKGESAGELAAFAKALLGHATKIALEPARLQGPTVDVCGTGGDKKGFFNVSTAVMFVAAAAGACVMKHGNRSVTSKTGAADVLEKLGVKIEASAEEVRGNLEAHGVAFIFARSFHPAFAAIGPVRAALAKQGVATIFNLLGPLLNPAQPEHQLVGIYDRESLPKYAEALRTLGRKRAWVVNGCGTDELTLTGESDVVEVSAEGVRQFSVKPEDAGLGRCAEADLVGGDVEKNAAILTAILDGSERGPKRDMVVFNTAAALVVCGIASDLADGARRAAAALDDGAAMGKLEALRK